MPRSEDRKAAIEPVHVKEAAALKRLFGLNTNLSQAAFGAEYGLGTQGNVWQYLNARIPLNATAASRFAKGLNVSVRDFSPRLAGKIKDLSQPSKGDVEIESYFIAASMSPPNRVSEPQPVYGFEHAPVRLLDARASAGNGSLVFSEDVDRVLMFRRDWLARHDAKPDDVLAFPVKGSSMIDMHIVDGSVVLVNQGKKEPTSKKVYVLWIDGRLYVKQLVKHNGQWLARSHNSAEAAKFPDIPIEIDARIVGRAFWCGFSL